MSCPAWRCMDQRRAPCSRAQLTPSTSETRPANSGLLAPVQPSVILFALLLGGSPWGCLLVPRPPTAYGTGACTRSGGGLADGRVLHQGQISHCGSTRSGLQCLPVAGWTVMPLTHAVTRARRAESVILGWCQRLPHVAIHRGEFGQGEGLGGACELAGVLLGFRVEDAFGGEPFLFVDLLSAQAAASSSRWASMSRSLAPMSSLSPVWASAWWWRIRAGSKGVDSCNAVRILSRASSSARWAYTAILPQPGLPGSLMHW